MTPFRHGCISTHPSRPVPHRSKQRWRVPWVRGNNHRRLRSQPTGSRPAFVAPRLVMAQGAVSTTSMISFAEPIIFSLDPAKLTIASDAHGHKREGQHT